MIQFFGGRASRVAALLLAALACLPAVSHGARVADLYAAAVPAGDGSPAATTAAFTEALRRVLVKVSGRRSAAEPAVVGRFGDPAALVQQFRREAGGKLWAQFDPAAVRRGLAAANLPVWGDDRPATLVWLAYDNGAGERDIVGSGADAGNAGALRQDLLDAAGSAGVPVVLPLRDSQDIAAVSAADVFGEFIDPLRRASARYQSDAILVGRARLVPPGLPDVRWTLLTGSERAEWRGGVADGPQGLAERLSQQLAGTSAGAGSLTLGVSGIGTLDQYGAVLAYLRGLDVVETVGVAAFGGDTVRFDLTLRGEPERLDRALALRRVLEPDAGEAADGATLHYRLVGLP
jgi:hypothetical protein